MRIGRNLCVIAGCVIAGVAVCLVAPALAAQGVVVSSGAVAGFGGVTGEPYTATSKTTRVQTLADGTEITHESSVKEARDSSGKTYRESQPDLPAGADAGSFALVNIFDPVNHLQISWSTRSKQATVFHMPGPDEIRSRAAEAPTVEAPVQPQQGTQYPAPQIERLGVQTINGVAAEGSRIMRTIPAGKEGNNQPIVITTETWRSNELKLVVRRITNDPRIGISTMELTDIQQGEPDPALFQVPEGYTVKDQFPQPQNQ
jgi:hypothetical protein